MRITELRATPVAVPFREDEAWAFGARRGMVSILLEVNTDVGLVGIGEAAAYPSGRHRAGCDPLDRAARAR